MRTLIKSVTLKQADIVNPPDGVQGRRPPQTRFRPGVECLRAGGDGIASARYVGNHRFVLQGVKYLAADTPLRRTP